MKIAGEYEQKTIYAYEICPQDYTECECEFVVGGGEVG